MIKNTTRWPANTGIFLPINKYFDQFLQTVENETSFESKFQRFSTNINSTTDFYILCKRGASRFSVEKFCFAVPKKFVGEPFCFQKISSIEKVYGLRGGGLGVARFSLVLIKFKNAGKSSASNPYLALQNRNFLPTVPWEQLSYNEVEASIFMARQRFEPGPTACEMFDLTPLRIYFSLIVGKNKLIKKRNTILLY